MNEIDILTNAGLSRTNAEMVVALSTLATTIGQIIGQQSQSEPPAPEPPAAAPVPAPDIPPTQPEGAAVIAGEVVGVDG